MRNFMDLNSIKRNIIVKALLFILSITLMTASAVCFIMWGYGINCGFYNDGGFYKTKQCTRDAEEIAWRVSEYINDQESLDNIQDTINRVEYLNPELCNVEIAVYQITEKNDEKKEVLKGSTSISDNPCVSGEYSVWNEDLEYTIKYYVSEPLEAKDMIYWDKVLYDFLNPKMDMLVPVGIAFFAGMVLCLICLMSCAGYRKDREEAVLNPVDKIPYDIFTAVIYAACISIILCMAVFLEELWYGMSCGNMNVMNSGVLYICTAGILLISALIIWFFTSIAARVKVGGWWKNSIIFMMCKVLWKLIKYIWSVLIRMMKFVGRVFKGIVGGIPLVWKLMTITCLPLLIMVICSGVGTGGSVLLSGFIAFIMAGLVFYISLCMKSLQKGGRELASGNEDYRIGTERMILDLKEHGENLNNIGKGMSIAVAQQMKSEHLKTELITNVSHDLKTPLTSIINYIDLLGKENLEGNALEYVEVLSRQAARLKKLTEDVVEASKVSTGNMTVELTKTDAFEIINQAAGEYKEKFENNDLGFILRNSTGKENVYITADGRLLWRAIDNLMSNICKYSQPGTRVYLDVAEEEGEAVISFKNISREELNISEEELVERFVRGDSSRSSEGSGLGLNIAKNLVKLQGGKLLIKIDGDLFKAEIRFKTV